MTDRLQEITDWHVKCERYGRGCMWAVWGWWSGYEARAAIRQHMEEAHDE